VWAMDWLPVDGEETEHFIAVSAYKTFDEVSGCGLRWALLTKPSESLPCVYYQVKNGKQEPILLRKSSQSSLSERPVLVLKLLVIIQ